MERCLTKDQLLQAPQEGLEFPSYGQQTPPFTLQGRYYTTLPETLTGGVVYVRKQNAVKDTSNFQSYFARDNYQEVRLAGESILQADIHSTLRFNQKTFTLKFGLLHRPVWSSKGLQELQVSLVFESESRSIFHICIPVVLGGDQKSENLFLASWLARKPLPPSGLSLNELLNFRGSESDVRFATLEFCLKSNVRISPETFDLRPYTVCIFKNPISILLQTCPEWLRGEPNLDKSPSLLKDIPSGSIPSTWRMRDFNECFNYIYRIMKPVLTQSDPFVISGEEHFDTERTQNVVKPAYFKTSSNVLMGRPLSGKQVKEGARGLQHVKCYPIDLAHQVDEGGNIYIDQESNKPINVKDAMAVSKGGSLFPDEMDTDLAVDMSVKEAEQASRVRFWIAFAVIMLILLAFLVTIIVYVFRGSSFSKTEFVPANTPVVAAINAAVNAAVNVASSSAQSALSRLPPLVEASNIATVGSSVKS